MPGASATPALVKRDRDLLTDPRVRSVRWSDLTRLSRLEVMKELTLSLPWLALSLYLAHRHQYVLAAGVSFMFFLAGLRQVHDAYHYNLGLSRAATEWVMYALSVVMLGSMHAVQLNHLKHHAHCMDDDDVEARSARMSGLEAFLWGPVFPVLLHKEALRLGRPRQRRWIFGELAANAASIILVFSVFPLAVLRYHIIVMTIGHCLTAFFAVWTVHHDCDRSDYRARTLRHRLKSIIAFHMFFHAEHHLFPKIPTCHLPKLARRLDEVVPDLNLEQVY